MSHHPITKPLLYFYAPSAFRPFGASANFFLQAPQKAVAHERSAAAKRAREISQSLEARQDFGMSLAMPCGLSFKFNFDCIRALLPGRREAGSGVCVKRQSDVLQCRIWMNQGQRDWVEV